MARSTQTLVAYLNDQPMGELALSKGALRFRYRNAYIEDPAQVPLSLSMPLSAQTYGDARLRPFLWGLLPDNEQVLAQWGRRYHVSPTNVFGLLRETGEDCAGAVRFFSPDRVERATLGGREPLTRSDVARRLKGLLRDPGLTRLPVDQGQFSLAGAQPKNALHYADGEWSLPWGAVPTTHILKPPHRDLDGHVENEHFCLKLAKGVGLTAATSEVMVFDDERAIVITRYDRVAFRGRMIRVHQENACQALGVHPANKYESEGGPGAAEIMTLLDQSSRAAEDRDRFMAAIAFNYLILGSDAHAKNFSLLLGRDNQVRFAPLYDLASLLPYNVRSNERRFAMKIGGHYRDIQIGRAQFEDLARTCRFPVVRMMEILDDLSSKLMDAVPRVATELRAEGLDHAVVGTLESEVRERAQRIRGDFGFK